MWFVILSITRKLSSAARLVVSAAQVVSTLSISAGFFLHLVKSNYVSDLFKVTKAVCSTGLGVAAPACI